MKLLVNKQYSILLMSRILVLWEVGNTVEIVVLLSNRKSKPDTNAKLGLSMDDYYRIKEEGKNN